MTQILENILAKKPKFLCDWHTKANTPFWQSPLGERVTRLERPLLSSFLARFCGDSVLWVGHDEATARSLSQRMIKLPVFLNGECGQPAQRMASLAALPSELPFQSRTLDGVVLHHTLEDNSDARLILRETTRVLAPGGRVLIVGFNPWSLLGLRRLGAAVLPDALRQQRFISPIRLFDWLTLLGLELDAAPVYAGFGLPFGRTDTNAALTPSQIPFAGVVVVSAVKQTQQMNLQWRPQEQQPRLAPVAYPRVPSWNRQAHRLQETPK